MTEFYRLSFNVHVSFLGTHNYTCIVRSMGVLTEHSPSHVMVAKDVGSSWHSASPTLCGAILGPCPGVVIEYEQTWHSTAEAKYKRSQT